MLQQNQNAQEQVNADEGAQQPAPPSPKKAEAARLVQMALGVDGAKDGSKEQAANVATLLKTHPDLKAEIIAFLHGVPGLGNSFVHQVLHPGDNKGYAMALNREENNVTAGVAPGTLGGESKARADDALADARELDPPAPKATNDAAPAAAESKPAAAPEAAPTAAPPVADAKPEAAAAAQAPVPAPPAAEAKQEVAPPAKNDPEPAAQGPVPAPDSAAAKNAEPAPEVANQPAPPAPVAAGPEAAPKVEDKAAVEQGKEEKPEEKAHGKVKITASALRVRAAASLNGAILGKLPRGREIEVEGHEGAWLKITWDGKPAFIHSKYTTSVKGNESGEEEEHGEQESQEQKQERPKNESPSNANETQQNDRV